MIGVLFVNWSPQCKESLSTLDSLFSSKLTFFEVSIGIFMSAPMKIYLKYLDLEGKTIKNHVENLCDYVNAIKHANKHKYTID